MFRVLFYPRKIKFYTNNVRASGTNSMSVHLIPGNWQSWEDFQLMSYMHWCHFVLAPGIVAVQSYILFIHGSVSSQKLQEFLKWTNNTYLCWIRPILVIITRFNIFFKNSNVHCTEPTFDVQKIIVNKPSNASQLILLAQSFPKHYTCCGFSQIVLRTSFSLLTLLSKVNVGQYIALFTTL